MVTSSPAVERPLSYGMAKRLRNHVESLPNSVVMVTVVCDECGARFAVAHRPASQDAGLAEKQAIWLKDRFVWDHIQENKHSGSIRLPGSHELKPASPAI